VAAVIVPGLVLSEVEFLRNERDATRELVAEIFDPVTRYEHEVAVAVPRGSSVAVGHQ
jgi:hypothetical protein